MQLGYLLNAANKFLATLTLNTLKKTHTLDGLPLGDTVGDGTGTIGLKVLSLGTIPGSSSAAPNGAITRSTANAAGTITVAARATRRTAVITCDPASPEQIYYGFTTGVTAANGQKLTAGQSHSIDYRGALFFFGAASTGLVTTIEIYD